MNVFDVSHSALLYNFTLLSNDFDTNLTRYCSSSASSSLILKHTISTWQHLTSLSQSQLWRSSSKIPTLHTLTFEIRSVFNYRLTYLIQRQHRYAFHLQHPCSYSSTFSYLRSSNRITREKIRVLFVYQNGGPPTHVSVGSRLNVNQAGTTFEVVSKIRVEDGHECRFLGFNWQSSIF